MIKHLWILACAQLALSVAPAADKYWDTSAAAGLQSGAGTWDTGTTSIWSTAATGTALTTWSSGDDAFFRTGGIYTVTVSGTVLANSISQSVTGTNPTLTGGTIQFESNTGISNTGTANMTINSAVTLNTPNLSVSVVTGGGGVVFGGSIGEIGGSRAFSKSGTGNIGFNGATANTYTGLTSLSGTGLTTLGKNTGVTSIAGDLNISGGAKLRFSSAEQIANTSNVTMSGAGSVYNGDGPASNPSTVSETIASLTVTGGTVNTGNAVQVVTGAGSFTGGAGNTIFVGNSGSNMSFGSLAITNMGATAGGTVNTANSFTVYGNAAGQSRLFVGAGGLTLTDSVVNLRLGNQGSRLALGGNVTSSGTTGSRIILDTAGGASGTVEVRLGESAGTVNRTFTTSAPLLVAVPINNGTGTTGSITKAGASTLTFTGLNTYTGGTTIDDGTLLVNSTAGTGTGAVSVTDSGTLGGTGSVTGAVTVQAGGTLQGGTGLATEDLTLSGNVTLQNDSVIKLTLGSAGAHSSLTRTGAGVWSFNSAQKFTLDDLGATAGLYNNIIAGVANPGSLAGWTITNSGWSGTFAYDGSNIDLTLIAVPEPGAAALLVTGIGMVYFRRRR